MDIEIIDKSEIFFKIFRNIVLKNKIFNYIKILNLYYNFYFNPNPNNDQPSGNNPLLKFEEFQFKDIIRSVNQIFIIDENNLIKMVPSCIDLTHNIKRVSIDPRTFLSQIYSSPVFQMNIPISPIQYFNDLLELDLKNNPIEQLEFIYPPNLIKLKLPDNFNKPLNNNSLPKKLKYLYFGDQFDQLLTPKIIPKTVELLSIGKRYSQVIKPNILPNGLKTLIFENEAYYYNFVKDSLPNSLEVLKFKRYFRNGKDIYLPPNLKKLYGIETDPEIFKKLPQSITKLHFHNESKIPELLENELPRSIRSIRIPLATKVKPNSLHEGIESIIGNNFTNIPNSIKKFKFDGYYHHFDSNTFNTFNYGNITTIIFGDRFNQEISVGLLSPLKNLKTIRFGRQFNCKLLPGSIHEGVENIELGEYYRHNIDEFTFPFSLVSLKINAQYEEFQNIILPTQLKKLHLASPEISKEISNDWLPDSLETLIVNGNPVFKLPLNNSINELFIYNNNTNILYNKKLILKLFKILKIYNNNKNNL